MVEAFSEPFSVNRVNDSGFRIGKVSDCRCLCIYTGNEYFTVKQRRCRFHPAQTATHRKKPLSRPISINLPSARFISLITSPLPGCQASEISFKISAFLDLNTLIHASAFQEITAPTGASSISVIVNSAVLATVTMDV